MENCIFAAQLPPKFVTPKPALRLPDAFMVGAAKSGTTSLYQMLAGHPAVYFPEAEKEPFFFCFAGRRPDELDDRVINRVTWSEEAYYTLYRNAPAHHVAIDASTAYLYKYEDVISNLEKYYGDSAKDLKIIIVLRNPVERAWSHYNFLIRNGLETLTFEEALKPDVIAGRSRMRWGFDYLGYGMYSAQVEAFKAKFPRTRIYLTEDLKNHNALLADICSFLGIAPLELDQAKKANPSGVPKNKFLVNMLRKNRLLKGAVNLLPEKVKHKLLGQRDALMGKLMVKPHMQAETRKYLLQYYHEDINRLEGLTGRDLSHWKS